jgi:hypothetical protein
MRYRRAVEKLRILAEACESIKRWPLEKPFLLEAYTFGDVLRGADPLDCVEVVLVLNLHRRMSSGDPCRTAPSGWPTSSA